MLSAPRNERTMRASIPSVVVMTLTLATALVMVSTSSVQAFQPRDSRETDAVNVRILQSEMMVAALTCNMRNRYNTVVVRYQGELVSHGRVLKKMFRRDHGQSAQKELDGFVTQLANDASIRSIRGRETFCVNANVMFTTILAGENTLAATGLRTVEEAVIQKDTQ